MENLDDVNEVTDDTPMPFGKHKGVKLKDVPDNYLYWVYCECKIDKHFHAYLDYRLEGYDDSEQYGGWCGLCARPDYACKCYE